MADYDPHLYRKIAKPTSDAETFTHLLKGAIGSGILSMPDAFKNAGYIGLLFTAITTALAVYGIQVLIRTKYILCRRRQIPQLSYPDAMKMALEGGPKYLKCLSHIAVCFVDGFLMIFQIGVCSSYIAFLAANMKSLVEEHWDFSTPQRIYMLFFVVPAVLLMCIPDLKVLAPFSTVANICVLTALGIIMYYILQDFPGDDERHFVGKPVEIPLFIGSCLFALEAVGVVLSVEANMATPKSFTRFCGVFNISMFIVGTLYAIIGLLGYMKYGDETEGSVIYNIPKSDAASKTARVLYIIAILFSYALQGYVGFEILWFKVVPARFREGKKSKLYEYCTRISIALLTFIIPEIIPDVGLIISFVGALCISMLGFSFPALIEIATLHQYREDYAKIWTHEITLWLLFLFGLFAMVIGVSAAIIAVL